MTLPEPNNPMSVVVVDPNILEKWVGGNVVSVKRITVQMTKDPISHKIEKLVPSLPQHRKAMSSLRSFPNQFAPHYNYFVRNF